jgi:hypothetical protein
MPWSSRGALVQWKSMVVQAHVAVDGGTSRGAIVYRFNARVDRDQPHHTLHITAMHQSRAGGCCECQRQFYVGVQTEAQSPTRYGCANLGAAFGTIDHTEQAEVL